MTLRILIADDELLARKRLHRLLSAIPDVEIAGECQSGEEVLAFVKSQPVDVLLLDIQMPGLTGLEAKALMPADGPYVIFTTAHPEHALEAFDVGAVDYVLKPVEAARLQKALERARGQRSRPADEAPGRLAVPTRRGIVLLDPLAVSHATFDGSLVTLFTKDGALLTDFTLQDLESKLPAGRFERVHRRALLNIEFVDRLEPLETGGYVAHTKWGEEVPVSRQAARELRKRLGLR